MNDLDNFEGEELDLEPYEGEPDYKGVVYDGSIGSICQDDIANTLPRDTATFVGLVAPPQPKDWRQTLAWYDTHRTIGQIGFDPDGMCLKVCRTARGIPAGHLTAREAMVATPQEHRITRVRDLRRGMVLYYADPNDNNEADHITTLIGRVRGFDPDSLHDVLTITNSVKSDELVVVRGDYFEQHWGDDFKFGATWLNGFELDIPNAGTKVERFHDSGPIYDLNILARAAKAGRPKAGLTLDLIEHQVKRLPDSPHLVRVRAFKEQHRRERKLHMPMLDAAVADSRPARVKQIRDEIVRLIATLPEE